MTVRHEVARVICCTATVSCVLYEAVRSDTRTISDWEDVKW